MVDFVCIPFYGYARSYQTLFGHIDATRAVLSTTESNLSHSSTWLLTLYVNKTALSLAPCLLFSCGEYRRKDAPKIRLSGGEELNRL